ncbi:hypothetical protein IIM_01733 [Bacillus cereus VD107]|nr:hypothetical protein IIM_01733 [Bacillus cereus VD107]
MVISNVKKRGILVEYDYARVSTLNQVLKMQIAALEKEKYDYIFLKKSSGTKTNRPDYFTVLNFSIACCSVAK